MVLTANFESKESEKRELRMIKIKNKAIRDDKHSPIKEINSAFNIMRLKFGFDFFDGIQTEK